MANWIISELLRELSDAGTKIADNNPQVQQYHDGNPKVLQFFVGQVMKLSRGKANPQMVVEMLKRKL